MDSAHSLSAVTPLESSVPVVKRPRRARRLGRLLVLGLLFNGALAIGATAAAFSFHAQLGALAQRETERAAHYAQAAERSSEGLAALGVQSAAVATELSEMRRAVASHAREEALFLKLLILKPSLEHALARRIAASVQAECERAGQDANLVLAIMAIESDFNPRAVSNQGAVGLMQVMPHWKKVLGLQEMTEPEVSIRAGIQILGYYQQMYRNLDLAVTAYNRGPGPVDMALVRGNSHSNGYAERVLATWGRLKTIDVAGRP